MKLAALLPETVERMEKCKDKIIEYKARVLQENKYKDFNTYFATGCINGVWPLVEIWTWYDKYNCNDEHITTLGIAALKKIGVL